jgi:AraC-like DNA-binding protein
MFFSENSFFKLEKGDLLMIRPGAIHAFLDAEPSEYARAAIYINPRFLEPLLGKEFEERAKSSDGVILVRAPEIYDEVLEELHIIMEHKDISNEKFNFLTMSLICKWIYYLLTLENIVLLPKTEIKNNKRMDEILRYITLNYTKPLTIPHIAGRFFISEYHLSRTFKKYVGKSITEYINMMRLDKAMNLLQSHPERKISTIAKECGFHTVSHFNHEFQKNFGMAPSEYRRGK